MGSKTKWFCEDLQCLSRRPSHRVPVAVGGSTQAVGRAFSDLPIIAGSDDISCVHRLSEVRAGEMAPPAKTVRKPHDLSPTLRMYGAVVERLGSGLHIPAVVSMRTSHTPMRKSITRRGASFCAVSLTAVWGRATAPPCHPQYPEEFS